MKDPNNLDAAVQMAFIMPTLGTAVQLLEEAKAQGT